MKALELKDRREERALRRRELEVSQNRGFRFTSSQATVAAAALALVGAIVGGVIQSVANSWIEGGKNEAQVSIEQLKVKGDLDLETAKQQSTERLERQKFETALIQKATEAPNRDDQIKNLKFFLAAGFISDPEGKIAKINATDYPTSPSTKPVQSADIVRQYGGSIGWIKATWSSGENDAVGFLVSSDGFVLTSAHLLKETGDGSQVPTTIVISFGSSSGPSQNAALVAVDDAADVALLRVPAAIVSELVPLPLSFSRPEIADSVTMLSLLRGTQSATLALGAIASVNSVQGGMAVTVVAAPGQSGSPLFDSAGNVVGIVRGTSQNFTIAAPVVAARSMLMNAGIDKG